MTTRYLLDSDILITSSTREYGMEFCPAFWEWLERGNKANKFFSIEQVWNELKRQADPLAKWADARGSSFFLPFDETATGRIAEVAAWPATQPRYFEAARAEFLGCADLFLVAYALAHGHVIVTHEKSEPNCKRKVKLPDVCFAFGVGCTTLFDLLRTEKPMFILQQTAESFRDSAAAQ